jgi:hypothetical protein
MSRLNVLGVAAIVWGLAASVSAQGVGVQVGVGGNQGGVYVGQPPPPPPQQVYVQPQPQQVYVQPQYGQQPVYAPQPMYQQPPRQQILVERPHIALIVPGAVLLGVGWIMNFIVGLPAGDDPFSSGAEPEWQAFRYSSLIPLAGPWIQLGVMPDIGEDSYWPLWLVFNGLLQATGVTLLIIGIATPQRVQQYADNNPADDFQLSLTPSVSPNHAGLSLTGRF